MKKKNKVIMALTEQHKDSQNRWMRQIEKSDFYSALNSSQYIQKVENYLALLRYKRELKTS